MEGSQFKDMFDAAKWNLVPLACIIVSLTGITKIKQSAYESFGQTWFIVNGAIIHIFLDGLIGCLGNCPPLVRVYSVLDNRYKI